MSDRRAERCGAIGALPSMIMALGASLAVALTGCSNHEIRSALRNPLKLRNHDAELAAISAPNRNADSGEIATATAASTTAPAKIDERDRALAVARDGALRDAVSGRGAPIDAVSQPGATGNAATGGATEPRSNSGFFARFLRPGFGRQKSNDPPLGVFGFRQTPSYDSMRSNGATNAYSNTSLSPSRETVMRSPRSGSQLASRAASSPSPSSSSSSVALASASASAPTKPGSPHSQLKTSLRPSPTAELAMSNASRVYAGPSSSSARAPSTLSVATASPRRSQETPKEPSLKDAADLGIPALPVTLTLRPFSDENADAEADPRARPAADSRIAMTAARSSDESPSSPPASAPAVAAKPARSVIRASTFAIEPSPRPQAATPDSPPVPDPDAHSLEEAKNAPGFGINGLWDRWLKKDRSS